MRHTHQVISYVLGMDRDDFDASARTWIERNRTRTTLLSFGHYCVTVSGSSRKALGRRGVPTPEGNQQSYRKSTSSIASPIASHVLENHVRRFSIGAYVQ